MKRLAFFAKRTSSGRQMWKKKNENTPPPTKKMRLFPEKLNTTSFICFLANVGKKKGYKKTKVSPLGEHTGVAQTWQ